MSPSQTGGWQDDPEEEREALWHYQYFLDDPEPGKTWGPRDLGELDPWEGWPEELSGPEYWLTKRSMETGEL